MKKKLPIAKKNAALAVKPVKDARRPEFPTRGELYRKAGVIGGATLLASGLAGAEPQKPAPNAPQAVTAASLEDGSINGKPLAKAQPKIKVYREGGGIGPAEDMWQLEDVEAFISWTMAKEGKLALKTKYKLDFDGTQVELDAFDPDRNIGYTYVDPHDPARMEFTAGLRAKLDQWMKDRKVAILFIEVRRYPDASTLKGKVVKFLHAVQQQPPAPGKIGARK